MLSETVIVMPVYNEADNIANGIRELKKKGFHAVIVGIDPATTDESALRARDAGAHTTQAARSGYDGAVSAGVSILRDTFPSCQYVVFFDAGGKFPIDTIPKLIAEAQRGADLVLATRTEARHLLFWHQKLGTDLVLWCIRILFKKHITDITPFRLIRLDVLERLDMRPQKYRWPSEMLVKCLALDALITEVPTRLLPRQGASKISSNLRNSIRAGVDMFSSLQFARFTNH